MIPVWILSVKTFVTSKAGLYVVGGIFLLLVVRWWSNAQYEKGRAEFQRDAVKAAKEEAKAELKADLEKLELEKVAVARDRENLVDFRKQVLQLRNSIVAKLEAGITQNQQQLDRDRESVASVPVDKLDGEIIKVLRSPEQ